MLRPSPVPLPTSLVVKKGSKTRPRNSGDIPEPGSVTDSLTYAPGQHPGHGSLIQDDVPCLDLKYAAVRHGVAPIQSQVEESGLQQRRVDMAQPQSVIDPQLDLAASSDRLADEFLKLGNELVCVDQFWVQYPPPRKSKKLRRQLCTAIGGSPCGCGELPDLANIRGILDELEIPGDHHKQVVEIVCDAARELADGLHLLALVKLLLHEAARFQGVLVLGDVSDVDRDTLSGGERIERVPDTSAFAERLEAGWAFLRHCLSKSVQSFRVGGVGGGLQRGHADNIAILGELRRGRPVDVADAPVPIDDEHAVGRTLKNQGDPSRGVLGLL